MIEPENTTPVINRPGVSGGRLSLLLLNVLLLLAFVTLTALNSFAPAQVHGARRISPTATASASAPTRSGAEGNSDRAPRATTVQTASANATAGRTATHSPSTPTAVPPTATASPVVSPSPTVSPTPCATCG